MIRFPLRIFLSMHVTFLWILRYGSVNQTTKETNMRTGYMKILTMLFLFTTPLYGAGNGWDHVKKNDYKAAKEEFLKTLEKDSMDVAAIKGMIFISETNGDNLSYGKYIRRLVKINWDENYFFLFEEQFSAKPDVILEQKNLSLRAKIDASLIKADEQFAKRKFDDANKAYAAVLGNFEWSVIGPFKNLSGSGHIEKFEVETDPYNTVKVYKDEDGKEYQWINPRYRNNTDAVKFSDYVSAWGSTVCYANSFIQVPVDRTVYIRIARKEPIKLWVDDDLVYENRDRTSFEWDNEVVELKLKAGTHRLLVKISDYDNSGSFNPYGYGYEDYGYYSSITSSYEDYGYEYDYYMPYLKGLYGYYGRNSYFSQSDFELRLTDASGKLFEDIKPSVDKKYTSEDYTPVVTSFFVLNHFKEQIKQDPEDLFNYFALQKAYQKYFMQEENEEYFVKYNRKNTDLVLSKYLAFDAYIFNGKKEKAYEVLNGIDHTQTPIFDILYQKLQEIDKVNDEDKYLDALDNLAKISPSNMKIIKRYIDYYEKKDMMDQKQEYVKQKIKDYPEYRYYLNNELKKSIEEEKRKKGVPEIL